MIIGQEAGGFEPVSLSLLSLSSLSLSLPAQGGYLLGDGLQHPDGAHVRVDDHVDLEPTRREEKGG